MSIQAARTDGVSLVDNVHTAALDRFNALEGGDVSDTTRLRIFRRPILN